MHQKPLARQLYSPRLHDWFDVYDAIRPRVLTLNESDRCSGARHDPHNCAVSTTIRNVLGADDAITYKTVYYELREWEPGKRYWMRFEVPSRTAMALTRYDQRTNEGVSEIMEFAPVRLSERGDVGKARKNARRKDWKRRKPGTPGSLVEKGRADRGGTGLVRTRPRPTVE